MSRKKYIDNDLRIARYVADTSILDIGEPDPDFTNALMELKPRALEGASSIEGLTSGDQSGYDLIIWRNTLQKEQDILEALARVSRLLAKGGRLVLETPIFEERSRRMRYADGAQSGLWLPTIDYLLDGLADIGLCHRLVKRIYPEEGSGPTRCILHCNESIPAVLLVTGASNDGKSMLTHTLSATASHVISCDLFVSQLRLLNGSTNPFVTFVQSEIDGNNLKKLYDAIDDHGFTKQYIELLCARLSARDRLTIIEGYMTEAQIAAASDFLKNRAIVWRVARV